MDKKTFFILLTILSALTLVACGSSSGSGGGGVAPNPQPTNLDPSFGNNGKVNTEFFAGYDAYAYAMAIRGDGKIVVAGFANNGSDLDFALARYNTDGSLDATFNNVPGCLPNDICNGKLITDFSGGNDYAQAVAIINGGPNNDKIVVAGWANNGTDNDFALARYNANGTPDTTFGSAGTGKVTTFFYINKPDEARAMALQSDGKIVLAGHSINGTIKDFALARYNTNGTLDSGFNFNSLCLFGLICNGKVTTDFSGKHDYVLGIAIQSDGKIVMVGSTINGTTTDFALTRYNTNGTLDTNFGAAGTGRVTTTFYSNQHDYASAVALQPDGKIVVAGSAKASSSGFNDFALARYNTNGTLDTSFNYQSPVMCGRSDFCSGQVVTGFDASGLSDANAVTIDGDGKIVAAGRAVFGGDDYFALVRYNPDGTLDISFGPAGTGKVTTDFGDFDSANAVALQSDGKIVAAGGTRNGSNYTFALARYLP